MANGLVFQHDTARGTVIFDATGYPVFGSNPGALTYATMQARIADEVLGSPTPQHIRNAIQDAISNYERESYWFNSFRYFSSPGSASNFHTTAGKEFYTNDDLPMLVNMPHISSVVIVAFRNRYALNERTPQWIDDYSVSISWQGLPTDFAMQANALRLYPVPDAEYPLILDGVIRFAPLVADGDYNCWTNEAERLIRVEAKRILFRDIIRDQTQVQAMEDELMGNQMMGRQGILPMLRRETARRAGGPGKLRASRGYM